MSNHITTDQVSHVAQLAHLTVMEDELEPLAKAFEETLDVIENLKAIDTSTVEPTHQVTGLENVLRDDVIDEKRMFSQDQAVANAKHSHLGYFVVNRIIDND
jgi:aspartyl-tRNA(Asn)/glutamyl-tRNA(Gln) amidotransferase subunit C